MNTDYLPEALAGLRLAHSAQRACSTRYNERFVGMVESGPDEITAMFYADRGSEQSRGVRAVVLARVMADATTSVWTLQADLFNRHDGLPISSRRGHSTAYVSTSEGPHRDLNSHSGSLI